MPLAFSILNGALLCVSFLLVTPISSREMNGRHHIYGDTSFLPNPPSSGGRIVSFLFFFCIWAGFINQHLDDPGWSGHGFMYVNLPALDFIYRDGALLSETKFSQ